MEYEPSNIFQVKLVVKNVVFGYPGTHSACIRVKAVFIQWTNFFSLNENYKLKNLLAKEEKVLAFLYSFFNLE